MSKITRFENLECWKAARELVKLVYQISNQGSFSKDYDLKSQMRRAAISSMNNIAEGFGRKSNKEFVRFLDISQSSAAEVKSMVYLCEDLNYAEKHQLDELHTKTDKTRNLTLGLIRYLTKKNT